MVGDAFAFLDPIFSTGVYLAMNSAERAAEVVAACLRAAAPRSGAAARAMRATSGAAWISCPGSSSGSLLRPWRGCLPIRATPCRSEKAMVSMLAGDVFNSPRRVVATAAVQADLLVDLGQPVAALGAQQPHPAPPGWRGLRRRGSDLNSPRVASRAIAGRPAAHGVPAARRRRSRCPRRHCARSPSARGARPLRAPRGAWPRVQVNLPALVGTGLTELWHADGKVEAGREGPVHFARGGHYLAGKVEIDERAAGGLAAAARAAYAAISRFTVRSGHRHLLRMYNYFSDINVGEGDAERYKLFCSGRAAGFRELAACGLAGGHRGRTAGPRQPPAGVLAGRCRARAAVGESAPGERLQLSAPVRPGAADLLARHAGGGRQC